VNAVESVRSRVHASTILIVVGFITAAIGGLGCSYWHHVAMQAGPQILLAGLVATVVEARKLGWRQALTQLLMIVPAVFLPGHVH
jgi:hypothetical protein